MSFVWDDAGNWGLAFTVGAGVGVKVGLDIPGLKNLAKAIWNAIASSSVGFNDGVETIYDLNGVSYNVEGGMLFGFKMDMQTGKFIEVSIGDVGGNINAEFTGVIPISDTPKAIMYILDAIMESYYKQWERPF